MRQTPIQVHALLRVVGSLCLTVGVFFSIFGASDRTASTFFLWLAFGIGAISLVVALIGGRSWYSGIVILGSTYFFFITRTLTALNTVAAMVALCVALYGIFLNPYVKTFRRRLLK